MKSNDFQRKVSRIGLLIAAGMILSVGVPAQAGGGPESVIVVVNEDSWASLAVANEFVHLRKIPPNNVIYLSGGTNWAFDSISIENFRKHILKPVLDEVKKRNLERQVDCIVYSADVPYRIQLGKDLPDGKARKPLTSSASINSMTYMYRWVLPKQPGDQSKRTIGYLSLHNNWYARRQMRRRTPRRQDDDLKALSEKVRPPKVVVQPPIGFSGRYGWTPSGQIATAGATGPRQGYVLSTVLAVTSGRGTSVDEAIQCLRRSAAADGTHPKGTIYYMVNKDVRSRTRQWGFDSAIAGLKTLGVKGETVKGSMPKNRKDVMGLAAGSAKFNWSKTGSSILPGAICEHLTSWGGAMSQSSGQTSCTEFIRAGAAGTCGTVTEPYAIQAKFPTSFMHYFYAAGCSLAEAFYQSVAGPYQLLIIGDPLCKPWAKIPTVTLTGIKPGQVVKGEITLTPGVKEKDIKIGRYELFIDGLRRVVGPPAVSLKLDTAKLSDGWHEIRIVAVTADAIATQGNLIVGITINNHGRKLDARCVLAARLGAKVPVSVKLPGAKKITIFHNSRELATIKGPTGIAKIDSNRLGLGTVNLRAVGTIETDGKTVSISSAPMKLSIVHPARLKGVAPPKGKPITKGLKLTTEGGKSFLVKDMRNMKAMIAAGVKKGQAFRLEGYFDVPKDDMYQFQVKFSGGLAIEVDGKVFDVPAGRQWKYLPVSLARGTHRFVARGKANSLRIDIRFGGPGAFSISEKRFAFRHVGKTPATTSQPEDKR